MVHTTKRQEERRSLQKVEEATPGDEIYLLHNNTGISNNMMIVNRRALLCLLGLTTAVRAFTTRPAARAARAAVPRFMAEEGETKPEDVTFESEEQKKQVVGNLVADDEWDGLTMELTDLVRKSCTWRSS